MLKQNNIDYMQDTARQFKSAGCATTVYSTVCKRLTIWFSSLTGSTLLAQACLSKNLGSLTWLIYTAIFLFIYLGPVKGPVPNAKKYVFLANLSL